MVVKKNWKLMVLAIVNLLFLAFCLQLLTWQNAEHHDTKKDAVAKSIAAQAMIGTRLIGEEYTPITTTLGAYDAKILSTNPEFAAVAVELLLQAGVQAGDSVAINMSSSFPALNIAVIAATDALGAKPIIVSSVGASTWGANRPDFTWLDMEQTLVEQGIWSWRSNAVGLGGGSDQGHGLTPEGFKMVNLAIQRSGMMPIGGDTLSDAIQRRIEIYKAENKGNLPKVLVNVGGNQVIFGEHGHDAFLREGLTQGYRPSLALTEGLATEFIQSNRAVIHFINIQRLAVQFDIRSGKEVGYSKAFRTRKIPFYVRLEMVLWVVGIFVLIWEGKQKDWWKS